MASAATGESPRPTTGVDLPRLLPWVVFLVAALLYVNTLPNDFVFDDTAFVTEDRLAGDRGWLEILTGSRRGLAELTLAINWAIDGDEPRFYRLFNLLIHALAGVTLFGVVRRAIIGWRTRHAAEPDPAAAAWIAFAVALIWVAHPLNTQSVAYLIQRMESMAGLFYLLVLLCVARQAAGGSAVWGILAIVACAAGALSKEIIATAPVVALLFDRTFFTGSFAAALRQRWWVYLGLTATLSLWLGTGVLDTTDAQASAGFGMALIRPHQYLLTQGEVILHYIRLSFVPWPLVLDYGWPLVTTIDPATQPWLFMRHLVIPVTIVAALLAVSIRGVIRNTWWGFVAFSFFAILSVTSSIVPIFDLAFEHRMYLSLACLIALVVVGVRKLLSLLPDPNAARGFGAAALAIAVVGLSAMTVQRNFEYADGVTIWTTVVERAPHHARGWHNLGQSLGRERDYQSAILAYQQALQRLPEFRDSHHNIAEAYIEVGRPDLALPHAEFAVEREPGDPDSRYILAQSLFALGQVEPALEHIEESIRLAPSFAKGHDLYGTILVHLGRLDEALSSFERAIELDPEMSVPHYNVALTKQRVGRHAEAAAAFGRAIDRDPDNPQYLRQYARLLATSPDASVRHGLRAVQLAMQAARLTHNQDFVALDTLAAAHAEAGQWEQAVSVQRHVVGMIQQMNLPPEVRQQLLAEVRQRLDLYERREPYREASGEAPHR
jgi:tetratricopeptide (TPR) repeat protein